MSKLQIIRDKLINNKKVIYSLTILLWIISTIFTYKALRQPLSIEKKIEENNIEYTTKFNYKSEILPWMLYPEGGIVDSEIIFAKVTKNILFHIDSIIKSEKPVKIVGNKRVILKIEADNFWEKEYLISQVEPFNMEGTTNMLINDDFTVNLVELLNFINKVEEDIKIRPSKYMIKLKPIIEGKIIYDDKEIPINQDSKINFEYLGSFLKLIGEKEYKDVIPLAKTEVIPNLFQIFNINIPIKTARYLFSLISITMFIILLVMILREFRLNISLLSEAEKINKKYKNRLIDVSQIIDISTKEKIDLKSFKSLLLIADEKELPILKFQENNYEAVYYIVDNDCIYLYKTKVEKDSMAVIEEK